VCKTFEMKKNLLLLKGEFKHTLAPNAHGELLYFTIMHCQSKNLYSVQYICSKILSEATDMSRGFILSI